MCVVYPPREIERLFPFVFMLRIQVFAQKLKGARTKLPSAQKLAGSSRHGLDDDPYPVHILTVHVHTVVGLYSFPLEINNGSRPVYVIMVHSEKDKVLREDVDLQRKQDVSKPIRSDPTTETHLLGPFS